MIPRSRFELALETCGDLNLFTFIANQFERRGASPNLDAPTAKLVIRIRLTHDCKIIRAGRLVDPDGNRERPIGTEVFDMGQFQRGFLSRSKVLWSFQLLQDLRSDLLGNSMDIFCVMGCHAEHHPGWKLQVIGNLDRQREIRLRRAADCNHSSKALSALARVCLHLAL